MRNLSARFAGLGASLFFVFVAPAARADEAQPAAPSETPTASATAEVPTSGAAPGTPASAQDASFPRVGGHFGLAIPLVTVDSTTTGIGADFATVGLAPGITVKLDEHWAVDFEFVAYSNFKGTGNPSFLVVDPGVVYNWGPFATGLRSAVALGGTNTQNWGVIPIINKGFSLGRVSLFAELDFPVFFRESGASFTVQPQLGAAF